MAYLGVEDNPLSLNRYTYCHNNPIAFVNPWGYAIRTLQINEFTISYDDEQFTSSEMDGNWSDLLSEARRTHNMKDFYEKSNAMGININIDSVEVHGFTYSYQYADGIKEQDVNHVNKILSAYNARLANNIDDIRLATNLKENSFKLTSVRVIENEVKSSTQPSSPLQKKIIVAYWIGNMI